MLVSELLSAARRKLPRSPMERSGVYAELDYQHTHKCSGVRQMSGNRKNIVGDGEHKSSQTIEGSHPSRRTRIYHDGRNNREEWQCEECRNWYTSLEWRVVNLKNEGTGADWCRHCRPPKAGGSIDHLWSGGTVLLSWNQSNDFTRAMKRAIERKAAQEGKAQQRTLETDV
jgi:hypothetical protein